MGRLDLLLYVSVMFSYISILNKTLVFSFLKKHDVILKSFQNPTLRDFDYTYFYNIFSLVV
jgi:hypothetical protein